MFMRLQAVASEPLASIARQASSMTAHSNPAARASSAEKATQKSVAKPQAKIRRMPRARSNAAKPVVVTPSASVNAE